MVHLSDHRNRNRIIKNSRQGPWQIILPGLRLFFASEDGKGQQMPRFPVWNDVLEMFHPVCKEWKLLTDARDLIKADRGCLQAGLFLHLIENCTPGGNSDRMSPGVVGCVHVSGRGCAKGKDLVINGPGTE